MVLYKSGLKMVTLKTLTVPLMKDTSGSGNYESCWPAIQKDAHGIVFVFNPDNSAHVKATRKKMMKLIPKVVAPKLASFVSFLSFVSGRLNLLF